MGARQIPNEAQPRPTPIASAAAVHWLLSAGETAANVSGAQPNWFSTLSWPAVVLLFAVPVGLAVWAMLVVRRMVTGGDLADGEGLTPESLRQLRDRNQITPEEYERLRKIVAQNELRRYDKTKSEE
ncbi:MAG: hypothetical protein NTW19_07725 [Planctomycetota bacterium]|nr:hypothetical protein [Planctomycetota bacterium]